MTSLLSASLGTAGTDVIGPVIGVVPLASVRKQPATPLTPPKATAHAATTTARVWTAQTTAVQPRTSVPRAAIPAGGPGIWTPVPGRSSYGLGDFAGDPYSGAYGTCTWYIWYRHRNEPLMQLGNAWQWAANARARGLSVGTRPVVGATATFQPGVEGAGGRGHVARVEAVLSNGWFIVSEMNFSWNGGGFGRVDYRYAYVGPGVAFIY